MFKKFIISFIAFFFVYNIANAQVPPDNSYCSNDGFTFYNGSLILNSDHQSISRVFQIQNVEGGTITLNRQEEVDPGMGAGWSSSIDAGQYSLLAINQRDFAYRCMINNPPIEIGLTDCGRVLRVCAIIPKQSLGSFWVSENKPLSETLRQLKSRRIID